MNKDEEIIKNLYQRYNSMRARCGRKGTAYEFVNCDFESFEEYLDAVLSQKRDVVNGIVCYSFKDFYENPNLYDIDKDVVGIGYCRDGIKIITKSSNRRGVVVELNGIEYASITFCADNAPLPDGMDREWFKYELNRCYRFRNDPYYKSEIGDVKFFKKGFNEKCFKDYVGLVKNALKEE